MNISDPIADMLTRIRNANVAMHDQVVMPASKQKVALAKILRQEGYIADFSTGPATAGPGELLTIEMKINYLEPIPAGLVTAESYVLRSSKRSAYAEIDIWAAGKLAARASTTYMIRPAA